jgi:SHS2 domain-containing protein
MSDLRFRQIETTADTGLLIWGRDEKELLENAASGFFNLMAGRKGIRKSVRREVRAVGRDRPSRLVAWLSEWLYLFETEGFLGKTFEVQSVGVSGVSGWGWGDRLDPRRHRLHCAVKGITYHHIEVQRLGERLRARVILDV